MSLNSAVPYGPWHHFPKNYYTCSSTSPSLTSCTIRSISRYYNYAGLWCMTMPLGGMQKTSVYLPVVNIIYVQFQTVKTELFD